MDEREEKRRQRQLDPDGAVKLLRGGEYILLLRDFWKALRSAWPEKKAKPPFSPHSGDEPQD